MAQTIYTGLSIDVRRVPDYSTELDATGNKQQVELPGFLQYGVNLDGYFKVLFQEKAPGTLADIERAKAQQTTTPPEQPPTSSG